MVTGIDGLGTHTLHNRLGKFALVMLVLAIVTPLCLALGLFGIGLRGTQLSPAPRSDVEEDDAGFPTVDWAYWKEVNPSVIGWITIPGTTVDYPIVQAPADDPQFYLTHDIYGAWNFTGCPYLDAACLSGELLADWNCVVYGHNMGWNEEMFAQVARYADTEFAQGHRTVLLQTPSGHKHVLTVIACEVVPGWQADKQVVFGDEEGYRAWVAGCLERSVVDLTGEDGIGISPIVTLCTCSYSRWPDERTLVYCMQAPEG